MGIEPRPTVGMSVTRDVMGRFPVCDLARNLSQHTSENGGALVSVHGVSPSSFSVDSFLALPPHRDQCRAADTTDLSVLQSFAFCFW